MLKRNYIKESNTKGYKSSSMLSLILVIAGLHSGHAQAPSMRDALEERQRLAEAQSTMDANTVANPSAGINVSSARMYNQLLTFRYSPSQRDPFISSVVISPFVTEEEAPLEMPADMEQVEQAKKLIVGLLKRKIGISGVAYGKVGSNYTIAYDGADSGDPTNRRPQVVRPGGFIVIEVNEAEQQAIDGAYKMAAEAGVKLNLTLRKKTRQNPNEALMLRVLSIDGTTMEIENPGGEGSFTVGYKKELELDDKPRPTQVQ